MNFIYLIIHPMITWPKFEFRIADKSVDFFKIRWFTRVVKKFLYGIKIAPII